MDYYRTAIRTDMSSRTNGGRFGGTSRRATPRLVSIHPRGMSPHGARWMASAVDGVCRGGGVDASLLCGVEYDVSLEYGGSVEYDASL